MRAEMVVMLLRRGSVEAKVAAPDRRLLLRHGMELVTWGCATVLAKQRLRWMWLTWQLSQLEVWRRVACDGAWRSATEALRHLDAP